MLIDILMGLIDMPTIKGNLILEKDTTYNESLIVEGSIIGKDGVRYNLTVRGDINCWNIVCGNIVCGNINCLDINCGNINCWDIEAYFVLCETMKQKEGSMLKVKNIIESRNSYKQREIKRD